jgi:hypothetical protein
VKIAGGRVLDTSSPLLLQLMMVMTIHIAVDWNRWVEPIAPAIHSDHSAKVLLTAQLTRTARNKVRPFLVH